MISKRITFYSLPIPKEKIDGWNKLLKEYPGLVLVKYNRPSDAFVDVAYDKIGRTFFYLNNFQINKEDKFTVEQTCIHLKTSSWVFINPIHRFIILNKILVNGKLFECECHRGI